MDFAVLGPLLIANGGEPVNITGAKERTLLAHLIANAGQMVPSTDLISSLWGESPPRSAMKSLQTYVLRVRNALEPHRGATPTILVTEGAGYRLRIDPSQVDAERFTRLVASGRRSFAAGQAHAASELFDQALDLWRGPAYVEFEASGFGRAEARRLQELRLLALEERCAAELQLGHAAAVVPELERLLVDYPLRENLWGQLVLALFRSGRQGEALAAYERARNLLVEELGIDPGAELRELQRRVLEQDATLLDIGALPHLPDELAQTTPPLVGRDAELRALWQAWHRAEAGEAVTVALRGPLGAGKTRLAAAFAQAVTRHGAVVTYNQGHSPARGDWLDSEVRLVVVDGGSLELPRPACLQLLLLHSDASVPESAEVIDLGPLERIAIRELTRLYVSEPHLDEVSEEVYAASRGSPGRAHQEAARVCHRMAAERVEAAAQQAHVASESLTIARTDLADGVAALREKPVADQAQPEACPWRGLESYGVADAFWFCGRERLVAELVARLAGSRVMGVVGASGSGKSSLVCAGLLAALAEEALPGSTAWTQIVMRPGKHPLRELARVALNQRPAEVGELLSQLIRVDENTDQSERLVLVVDQVEELWTECTDDDERAAFLDILRELVEDPRSPISLILVVRADFVSGLADEPVLAKYLADATILVGSPTPAELSRAVELPARRGGLVLEHGLADTLVADAGAEPGSLPLLAVALSELWESRAQQRLTFAGYVAMGGLNGAIAHLADTAYHGLTAGEQTAARVLFLRLTGPGDGATVTRRRADLAELEALPDPTVRRVVHPLSESRLLTVSDGYVEVAHEALFREWPRLRDWLIEDASGRAVQRRLVVAAAEWNSESREPTLLWRGARLESALEVAELRPGEITAVERAFLDAGRDAIGAEQRQTAHRAAAAARQNRRLKWLLAGLVVMLAVALVTGFAALRSRSHAEDARAAADVARLSADAKRLAADALNIESPDLALLSALEATKVERSPETYGALLTLLARQPDVLTRVRTTNRFLRVTASPDGRTVYLGENYGGVWALDAITGRPVWRMRSGPGMVNTLSISADGARLFITYLGGESMARMVRASTGDVLWRLDREDIEMGLGPGAVSTVDIGGWYSAHEVVVSTQSHLSWVNARTGQLTEHRAWPRHYVDNNSFQIWPDGSVSVSFDPEYRQGHLFDPQRWRHPRLIDGTVMDVTPDLRRLVVVSSSASGWHLQIIDSRSLEPISARWPLDESQGVYDARFGSAGSRLLVTSDETLEVRDGRTGELLNVLVGHSGFVMEATTAGPGEDIVWTAGRDGLAVAFDGSGQRGVIRSFPITSHGISGVAASDKPIAVYNTRGSIDPPTARLMDPRNGRDLGALPMKDFTGCSCSLSSLSITPDGAYALGGVDDWPTASNPTPGGSLIRWDVNQRKLLNRIELPWGVVGIDVTEDGRVALLNGRRGYALVDLRTFSMVAPAAPLPFTDFYMFAPTAAVSPDGRLGALGRTGEVVLVDLNEGGVVARQDIDADSTVMSLAWSADSAAVAVGTNEGYVEFLSAPTLEPLAPRRLITGGYVNGLATSHDGTIMASLGGDGDTMLWDTKTWKPYGQPVTDQHGLGWLHFAPDGHTLRVFFEEGTGVELETRAAAWINAGCRAANRNLTSDESAILRPGDPQRPTC